MNSRISLFVLVSVISTSCWDTDNALTTVKGKVTNYITGDELAGIPVELVKCPHSFFMAFPCDSVKSVLTDHEGDYELTFLTESGYFYKIGVAPSEKYGSADIRNGPALDEGKLNLADFQVVPHMVLEIHLSMDKGGKNYLIVDFSPGNCDTGWYGGTVIIDTARSNQMIDTVVYRRAAPLCHYTFNKTLCHRSGVNQPYDCENYPIPRPKFYIDYVDTTRIELN